MSLSNKRWAACVSKICTLFVLCLRFPPPLINKVPEEKVAIMDILMSQDQLLKSLKPKHLKGGLKLTSIMNDFMASKPGLQ